MSCPLIVVLPIQNAASLLRREVEDLLDLLAETSPEFELILVDVGSTDDMDLAGALAREFPQVRFLRRESRQSLSALVADIRARSGADVIVHGGLTEVGDLDRMCRQVAKSSSLPAVAQGPHRLTGNLLAQLTDWGKRLKAGPSGPPQSRPATFMAHLRQLASAGRADKRSIKLAAEQS